MYNILYSLISLIIALFFILVGVLGIMIPWSPIVRSSLIQFILEDSLAISLFGFAFIVIGLAIVVNIILGSRKKYYHLKSGEKAVAIDEGVIQQYLSIYLKQIFPDADIPYKLNIKKNKISLSLDLPYYPPSDQRLLLENIRQDFRRLLSSQLGYDQEFSMSASFQKQK